MNSDIDRSSRKDEFNLKNITICITNIVKFIQNI